MLSKVTYWCRVKFSRQLSGHRESSVKCSAQHDDDLASVSLALRLPYSATERAQHTFEASLMKIGMKHAILLEGASAEMTHAKRLWSNAGRTRELQRQDANWRAQGSREAAQQD